MLRLVSTLESSISCLVLQRKIKAIDYLTGLIRIRFQAHLSQCFPQSLFQRL